MFQGALRVLLPLLLPLIPPQPLPGHIPTPKITSGVISGSRGRCGSGCIWLHGVLGVLLLPSSVLLFPQALPYPNYLLKKDWVVTEGSLDVAQDPSCPKSAAALLFDPALSSGSAKSRLPHKESLGSK